MRVKGLKATHKGISPWNMEYVYYQGKWYFSTAFSYDGESWDWVESSEKLPKLTPLKREG